MTDLITLAEAQAEARSRVAEAMQMVEIARDFTVTSDDEAIVAAEQLSAIVKFVKAQEARRLELTRPYDATKADITKAFNEPTSKASEAEKLLRAALLTYQQEQQRIAAERQRQEQERIERERREAEAEAEKQRQRAAELKTDTARERAQEKAEEAEAKAEELAVTSAVVEAPKKLAGFSVRDNWTFDVAPNGLEDLVAAIAGGRKDLLQYLALDLAQIGRVVKAMKANTQIPGIKAVNRPTSTVR